MKSDVILISFILRSNLLSEYQKLRTVQILFLLLATRFELHDQ